MKFFKPDPMLRTKIVYTSLEQKSNSTIVDSEEKNKNNWRLLDMVEVELVKRSLLKSEIRGSNQSTQILFSILKRQK